MRVCFLHPGFSRSGGIERVVSVIINNLSQDQTIEIFSLGYGKLQSKDVYELNLRVHNDYLYDGFPKMSLAILRMNAIGKTVKYLKENAIDLIVGCGALYFPLTVIAAKRAKVCCACWEHTNPKVITDYRFQKQCRQIGMHFSDANIVITKAALNYYERKTPKKNVLIYNPVDPALNDISHVYNACSKKIISVGRLASVKNYEAVVEICQILIKKGWAGVWDIYGDGPERERLIGLINSKGMKDIICLKGNLESIYEMYNSYSVLVMTSKYEGFPMVLLEAATSGLPMISFDIETGPNEIITDGKNGFLVPPFDLEYMADKIFELYSNKAMREKMSQKSFESARSFSIDSISRQWRFLFNDIVKK